jgi:hypothetical protein
MISWLAWTLRAARTPGIARSLGKITPCMSCGEVRTPAHPVARHPTRLGVQEGGGECLGLAVVLPGGQAVEQAAR